MNTARHAGAAENVLSQHVKPSAMRSGGVSWARSCDGADRAALHLQHLEAIGRDEDAARRLVEAVIGAADALQEGAEAPFGAPTLMTRSMFAPVDAEIEQRGAHDGAEPARSHGVLDLAALRHVERAVVKGDGETVVVDVPERVEDHLSLAPLGVDENERHLVPSLISS